MCVVLLVLKPALRLQANSRNLIFSLSGDSTPMPNPLQVRAGDTIIFDTGVHNAVEGVVTGGVCLPATPGAFMTANGASGSNNTFTYFVPASDAGKTRNFYCDVGAHCLQGMVGSIKIDAVVPAWYV